METTRIYIKNMVCPRCIMVVRDKLESQGVRVFEVSLGIADIQLPTHHDLRSIGRILEKVGFELLFDEKQRWVEGIKEAVGEYLETLVQEPPLVNLSQYVADKLNRNYYQLSKAFSQQEGISIEAYFIAMKVEKVKEMLAGSELQLAEISDALQYSSVQYFSTQFKKATGYTPSQFRKEKQE